MNKYEDYATMGRGGSDTTAVAIAAAPGADACEIYTDVDLCVYRRSTNCSFCEKIKRNQL